MNRLTAYARLVRLPNVFTACADISVGVLAGHVPFTNAMLLLGSSVCLYSAGMASNDYFDREVDAVERPQRPIPRGAISPTAACGLVLTLVTIGLTTSFMVGANSLICAIILVALILAYNTGLKSTLVGPLLMGGCRLTNVILGFSATPVDSVDWSIRFGMAAIVGLYIVGITVFARDEAGVSRRPSLMFAAGVSMFAAGSSASLPSSASSIHPYMAAGLALLLTMKAMEAIAEPTPVHVQCYVKTAIFCLIVLDSVLAVAVAGPMGLCVLLWLIPAVILGKWVYST